MVLNKYRSDWVTNRVQQELEYFEKYRKTIIFPIVEGKEVLASQAYGI